MSDQRANDNRARAIVLVVEDEAMLRIAAVDLIESAGYKVIEAINADEAIVLLESRPDIRIVFTDIDMPGSMDGLKLAAAVRDRWPPIEIIVTSGHYTARQSELPERSIFLPKPYTDRKILDALERFAA